MIMLFDGVLTDRPVLYNQHKTLLIFRHQAQVLERIAVYQDRIFSLQTQAEQHPIPRILIAVETKCKINPQRPNGPYTDVFDAEIQFPVRQGLVAKQLLANGLVAVIKFGTDNFLELQLAKTGNFVK